MNRVEVSFWVLALAIVGSPALAVDADPAAEQQAPPASPKAPKAPKGFVYIHPGSFHMGSAPDELARDDDEHEHTVTLTRAYWLSTTEVSQQDWTAHMRKNPSYFSACGKHCPVERVNWYEVLQYLNRLSRAQKLEPCYTLHKCRGTLSGGCPQDFENDGLWCEGDYVCESVEFAGLTCEGFRLPTEAEWEYAARAGTRALIWTGAMRLRGKNDAPELSPIAWYAGNCAASYRGAYFCGGWLETEQELRKCGSQPVRQRQPNPWGLFDVLGNVHEWTWDGYSAYPQAPVRDPISPPNGTADRVYRGGGWLSDAGSVRAANRGRLAPNGRNASVGFRVARSVQ